MAQIDNLQINVSTNAQEASKAFSSLSGAIKGLGKSTGSIDKTTAAITKSTNAFSKFTKSLGRIAYYRLIRSAIKAVGDGVKEGAQNLYVYSDSIGGDFAKSLDTAATALLYMKNAFATAFAPLGEIVVPYLDKAIDKLVEFINTFNEAVAFLRGDPTFEKAKKVAQDFGDSLDGVKKSADEAKRSILGFDEINRLNDNSSSKGGRGSASDGTIMFEPVGVGEGENKLIDYIKKVGLTIEDVKPLLLTGAGLILGVWGAISGNPTLALAGLALAGYGLNEGAKEGTFGKLFGAVGATIEENTPLILSGIGIVSALWNFLGGNIQGGLAGLALAGYGIVMGAQNGYWSAMWSNIKVGIAQGKPEIIQGAMAILALAGLLTGNFPAAFIALEYLNLFDGTRENFATSTKWKSMWDAITKPAANAKAKLVGIAGALIALIGLLTWNIPMALSGCLLADWSADLQDGNVSTWGEALQTLVTNAKQYLKDIADVAGLLLGVQGLLTGDPVAAAAGFLLAGYGEISKALGGGDSWAMNGSSGDKPLQSLAHIPEPTIAIADDPNHVGNIIRKKKSNVVAYASGGFPEDGIFFANHNELVGQFSNGRTAVANNGQIIEGIKEGVYEAVSSAMSGRDGSVNVYLDGKLIAKEVQTQTWNRQRALGV